MNTVDDHEKNVGEAFLAAAFNICWLSLVYSPFVFTGTYVFFKMSEKIGTHASVSAAAGIVTGLTLFMAVAMLEIFTRNLRSDGKGSWVILRVVNCIFVCGLPFVVGGSVAVAFFGASGLGPMGYWAVFCIFGVISAMITFSGICGKITPAESEIDV